MCDGRGAWHVRRPAQFRSLVGALGGHRGQETLRDRRSFVPSVGRILTGTAHTLSPRFVAVTDSMSCMTMFAILQLDACAGRFLRCPTRQSKSPPCCLQVDQNEIVNLLITERHTRNMATPLVNAVVMSCENGHVTVGLRSAFRVTSIQMAFVHVSMSGTVRHRSDSDTDDRKTATLSR